MLGGSAVVDKLLEELQRVRAGDEVKLRSREDNRWLAQAPRLSGGAVAELVRCFVQLVEGAAAKIRNGEAFAMAGRSLEKLCGASYS